MHAQLFLERRPAVPIGARPRLRRACIPPPVRAASPHVGAADDPLEREADSAAEAVVSGRSAPLGDARASSAPYAPTHHGAGAAAAAVAQGGEPLSPVQRDYFEPRFGADLSGVRVHTHPAAVAAARGIGATAYTLGSAIALTPQADRSRVMAHELAHVVQQASGMAAPGLIQRYIAPADLPNTPVETIMADPDYFENGIERIEFFSAELARLHYAGGRRLDIGLVPELVRPPFEAVDYRTERAEHLPISPAGGTGLGTGSITFVPRVRSIQAPAGASSRDVIQATQRTIRFAIEPGSGRIVPTEVNSVSAPRLCAALRGAEAAYVRQMDEIAAGAIRTLRVLEWVVILGSVAGGLARAVGSRAAARTAAGRGAVAAAGGPVGRGASEFARIFGRFIGPRASTAPVAVTVEGVGFGGVRATVQGTELIASYSHIVNVGRVAGQGRLMHGALEAGAIQAARAAGLRSARVAVELVMNPAWKAYLESLGYSWEVVSLSAGGFTGVFTKVFRL